MYLAVKPLCSCLGTLTSVCTEQLSFNHGSSPKQGHDNRLCVGVKSERYKCTADLVGGEVVPKGA